jgi:hypothetical protein
LIGGFNTLPDWLPFIPQSELSEGGRVRTLQTADGAVVVERLPVHVQRQENAHQAVHPPEQSSELMPADKSNEPGSIYIARPFDGQPATLGDGMMPVLRVDSRAWGE